MPTLPCDRCGAPLGILLDPRGGILPLAVRCPACSHPAMRNHAVMVPAVGRLLTSKPPGPSSTKTTFRNTQ